VLELYGGEGESLNDGQRVGCSVRGDWKTSLHNVDEFQVGIISEEDLRSDKKSWNFVCLVKRKGESKKQKLYVF